jgi:hypothetical protein
MRQSGELAHTSLILGLLGTMVGALGLSLSRGTCLSEADAGWGRHSDMASHAAAGFIMLGSSIMVRTWYYGRR